ncbi:hypothetical protein HOLleu_45230 [Holothuria leucospilota]|uniref:Uncharacterized protein n=1 Tax=Holothuria leucospilota TaxID=206669 RepID=A0A9Q0YBS1_HOLLE|nr:hypothetical protein HOLleu_45230 [Holothuria leucospilota]
MNRVGGTSDSDKSRNALRELISSFNLLDGYRIINHCNPGLTWFRSNSSSRLDRIYVSRGMKVLRSETIRLPYSDHNPVFVDFEPIIGDSIRKGYWKYNVSLNTDEDFCNDLRFHYQLWKTLKPGFPSLSEWWEEVKNRVKNLAIKHSKRRANEKKEWLKHLQTRCRASQLEDVDSVISDEAEGAFIRSRANYLDLGERPSSFFFRLESRRGNKKVIRSIRGPNGVIYDRKDDICKVFYEYYSSLFSKDKNTDSIAQNDFIKNLNVSIHTHHKEELDLPISIDEVFSALKTASKNKAPGIDGLPY